MSHLHLNIFPIALPDAEISVGVQPFDSKNAMRELRKAHAGTHAFNRVSVEENGKKLDLIYAVRLDGTACTICPETKKIRLRENLGVARQLVNESFIASFAGKADRKIVDVGPLKVLSSEKEHDFIAQAVNGATVPPWLLVRLAHAIEARVFQFDGQDPFLGLVFDHHTYRRIARPCSEWLADRFDLTGLYVSEKSPFNDARIEPRARLVGRVAAINGSTLQLTDCREGQNTVEAKDVEIEADYDSFMRCLNATFKGRGDTIDRQLFDLQSAAQVGPKKLSELTRIENRLTAKSLRLLPGLEAPVLPHLDAKGKRFPIVHQAPQALYVFDRTFNKPALNDAKRGIFELGPYSQQGFTPSTPRICVICERSRKGEVEQFLQKLLEGHNEPGRKCFFPNGFIKTYRLQGKDVRFFLADNTTALAYRKAAQEALAAVTTEAERWHLAYVQVSEASHDMRGETNPYLVAKATFLSQQIPTQEFMIETSRRKGSGLDFILSNIALASYAKLGGTPWHLKVNNPMAHELVVGLGSTSISDSKLGARHRIVGITTMFTSEGRYLLGNMSNAVPFEDYGKAVVEMLTSSIERARSDMNWQKGDEVRLIFHSFKPLKDTEADAVNLMLITDARAVLLNTAITDAEQNPLVAAFLGWLLGDGHQLALLEEVAARAAATKGADRTSRNVAVLGFACGVEKLKARFAAEFAAQLEWSIGRPNFATGGEPCGVVADPLNFAGVVAGAESVLDNEIRQRFEQWAAAVWKDADGLIQDGGWRRGLLDVLGRRIAIAKATVNDGNQPAWLAAALHRRGWSVPAEKSVSDVLKAALNDASNVTDGFEAGLRLAAIDWAVHRAMDFDIAALTLPDVAAVLHRVPTAFQRWTWEDKPRTAKQGAQPRRWHIENEYHFQSMLYAVLKPLIPALEEEQYLPPTGTYQPRADLCILGLELVVEVKFWYRGKSVKDLTEEIAADLTLYLRKDSPYRAVIAAIWDDGARTEEQAELKRGLKGLSGLFDVVIVNRPSCMNDHETIAPVAKKKAKKES